MSNYEIARQIKPIRPETLERLFLKLRTDYQTISPLSIKYNNIADFYTFQERLNTIGIKNINFYDFYRDKEKYHHWIKNILQYYRDKKNKTPDVRIYKNIFNLYFGSITNFSIPNVLQVLQKYKPTRILDPTCGFGNRMVGCAALDVETYIGIDNNKNLELPLNELRKLLTKQSKTQVEIIIEDCLQVDYSKYKYDCVFTSFPYYNTEIYGNKKQFESKQDWNENFYKPIIEKTYKYLENNGLFIINVPETIYKTNFVVLLGECDEKIILLKRKRNNGYGEFIYVWRKK